MRRVLAAGKARFHHCKAALEEEDHKRADHNPGVVCAEVGLIGRCRNVRNGFGPGGCSIACTGGVRSRGLHGEEEQQHGRRKREQNNNGKDRLFHNFPPCVSFFEKQNVLLNRPVFPTTIPADRFNYALLVFMLCFFSLFRSCSRQTLSSCDRLPLSASAAK
ncbi:hypothetical protein SDC9_157181 [bioreactor metagenome]|uniref:Uncharacterized protein n=1 Tax=bioreactor metagenome TaxID=1076179 RepID=A0A645F692_9ZZZZ